MLFRDHLRTLDFDIEIAFDAWLDMDMYGPNLPALNPKIVSKGMSTEDNLGLVAEWTDYEVEKVIKFYAEMHNVSSY